MEIVFRTFPSICFKCTVQHSTMYVAHQCLLLNLTLSTIASQSPHTHEAMATVLLSASATQMPPEGEHVIFFLLCLAYFI